MNLGAVTLQMFKRRLKPTTNLQSVDDKSTLLVKKIVPPQTGVFENCQKGGFFQQKKLNLAKWIQNALFPFYIRKLYP